MNETDSIEAETTSEANGETVPMIADPAPDPAETDAAKPMSVTSDESEKLEELMELARLRDQEQFLREAAQLAAQAAARETSARAAVDADVAGVDPASTADEIASPAANPSAIDQIASEGDPPFRDSVIAHIVQQIEQWPDRLRERDAATLDEYRTRISALKPGEFSPDDAAAIDAYVNEIIETQFVRMIDPPQRNEVRGAIAACVRQYGGGPILPTEMIGILHPILRLNAMLGVTAAIISAGTSNTEEDMLEFESTALRVSIGGLLRCCEGWE